MAGNKLAELDGGPQESGPSIWAHIEEGLAKCPNGAAVIVMNQPADHLVGLLPTTPSATKPTSDKSGCLVWTYKQIHHVALNFASGLAKQGIKRGMTIATLIPNRIVYSLTLWMCTIYGLTLYSLDHGALSLPRAAELDGFMKSLKPDVVVAPNEAGVAALDKSIKISQVDQPRVKIALDGAPFSDWTSILDIATEGAKKPISEEDLLEVARSPDPDSLALILYTSGTSTGKPKGCPRHIGSMIHVLAAQTYGLTTHPQRRALMNSTNFRIICPILHFTSWKAGSACVISDPAAGLQGTLDAIKYHRVNFIIMPPRLSYLFLAHPEFKNLDTTCVNDLLLGGDVVTKELLIKGRAAFPHSNVFVGHGMTEGGGVVHWPYWGVPTADIPTWADISPLGKITPGAKLRVQDLETGEVVKKGETGELFISCESNIKHYLNNEYADNFCIDKAGQRWLRTGDIALISPDDVIFILGRWSDVIKRAGVPITPVALEICIEQFTGSQCAVMAWPHRIVGQEPLAVVKNLNGKTEEDVKKEILDKFGKDYALGPVLTAEQVGLQGLPLNVTGKVMKTELEKAVKAYYNKF